MLAVVAAGAAGGRFTAAKPTISHSAYGQFTIDNYDANLTYTVSATSGSVSRSGAVITASATDTVVTVTAGSIKGGSGTPTTAERKAYTYYYGTGQSCSNNCQPGGGPSGANSCWCGSSSDGYQTCCGGCYGQTCTNYQTGPFKNSTPSGYADTYSEWWKIT